MKTDLHPKYFSKASVTCACGNKFFVGSTKEFIETEICAKCHPFYTGKQKIVDTAGRVDRFQQKYGRKGAAKAAQESQDSQAKSE